jgi:hypothetical protein
VNLAGDDSDADGVRVRATTAADAKPGTELKPLVLELTHKDVVLLKIFTTSAAAAGASSAEALPEVHFSAELQAAVAEAAAADAAVTAAAASAAAEGPPEPPEAQPAPGGAVFPDDLGVDDTAAGSDDEEEPVAAGGEEAAPPPAAAVPSAASLAVNPLYVAPRKVCCVARRAATRRGLTPLRCRAKRRCRC